MAYTPTAPLICTLADVKAALRVTDTTDDDRISLAIDSASRKIETYCHRRFWQDPAPRTDAGCTITKGSATVLDSSIVNTGTGNTDLARRPSSASGSIPSNAVISSILPGVSFTMSDLNGNPVLATGNASESVTIGLAPRRYVSNDPWLVEVDDFFTAAGLVVQSDYAGDGTFGTTWTPFDYQLEPINGLMQGQPWPFVKIRAVRSLYFPVWGGIAYPKPYTQALVEVTAQWGWPTSSFADVYQAAIIESIAIFKAPDVPFGATPFGESGVLRLRDEMHPTARSLLGPYAGDPDALYIA